MKQTTLLLVLVISTLLCVAHSARNAGLSSAITETDITTLKDIISSHTSKDFPKDVNSAFYAVSALGDLDKAPKQKEIGDIAKEALKNKNSNLETIYQAATLVANLKVDGVTVDKAVVDNIKDAIENGDSLTDIYYAGMAALALKSRKLASGISDDDLSPIATKLNELSEEDGTFRSSAADKEGSVYNAGLALELLARLSTDVTLTDDDKEHVDAALDRVESMISLGNEEDGALGFTHSDDSVSSLATTSAVIRGLNAFAKAVKKPIPDVTAEHINQIGQYLVNHKGVGSLTDAYHLLSAIRSIQDSTISIPLVVSLDRSSISGSAKGAEGHLRVRVTDIFGKPVGVSKVYLTKAHPVGRESQVLISNQDLTLDADKQSYSINFLGAKPEQGFYGLDFRVVPAGGKYATIDSAVRTVKVTGSISITDLEIAVTDSKDSVAKASEGSRYKAADQSKKIDDVIKIDHVQFVNVQFRVRNAAGTNKPIVVQQAFVKFTHSSGQEATFVATPNDNKVYHVLINVEEVAKTQFRSLSGDYKVEIIVGDAFIQNPVHWVAASNVKISFISPATTTSRHGHGPLPDIVHKFREPEKRPSLVISNAFTLAVLSPLAFLFIGFLVLGANISQFPFSGMDFPYAVGFIGSIGATLALIAFYWLKLNLVQTLGYLGVLSLPTVFFGQRALSAIARRKEKVE